MKDRMLNFNISLVFSLTTSNKLSRHCAKFHVSYLLNDLLLPEMENFEMLDEYNNDIDFNNAPNGH